MPGFRPRLHQSVPAEPSALHAWPACHLQHHMWRRPAAQRMTFFLLRAAGCTVAARILPGGSAGSTGVRLWPPLALRLKHGPL
jgi:hypothetical protein